MTVSDQVRTFPFGDPDRLVLDPAYAELRKQPLIRVRMPYGEEAWLACRYDDIKAILADPRFSRAAAAEHDEPRYVEERRPAGILGMDPPEHTRLRKLVAKAFTARRVELLRPRAQEIADGLVDTFVAAGPPADLVDSFSLPLPIQVICELLGVPFEDRGKFRVWSQALLSTTALTPAEVNESTNRLTEYMGGLVAQRRVAPTDDLIGDLVRARDEEDRLSEEEMVRLAFGLLVAGHETTANQISNFMFVLFDHPDELDRLRADPDLVPQAVEELLRWTPLGGGAMFARYALEDVEVGGVTIRAGEPVLAAMSASNRDDAIFADPDRLDLTRSPNPHIGFGHGAHHCVGAPLARMELQVALGTLLRRLPTLRLAVPKEDLQWRKGYLVRGLLAMPVAW